MVSTHVRQRPGGRAERVRQAAFAAALQLYRPGEQPPSMAAIAAFAGLQKTTLYRRWGSVEALLHEAIAQEAAEAIPVPDTGSLLGDLTALATAGHAFLSTVEGRSSLQMLVHATEIAKQRYWATRYARLAVIFDRAHRRQELVSGVRWQSCLDVIIGTSYFSQSLQGELLSEESLLHIVRLLCTAITRAPAKSVIQPAD